MFNEICIKFIIKFVLQKSYQNVTNIFGVKIILPNNPH